MPGDLGEAADGAQDQRLAEGEAGVEDAGVLGVAVGEDDDVGAAEDRRDLGVLDEAGEEADPARAPRRRAGAAARRPCAGCRRSRARRPRRAEGLEQGVDALVGAQQAEEEDHRALGALQLGRQRLLLRQPGEVVEGAVGDDPDAARVEPDLARAGGAAPCSEWATTASIAAEDAAGGRELAAARPRRQDVVRGHHPGAGGGSRRESRPGTVSHW